MKLLQAEKRNWIMPSVLRSDTQAGTETILGSSELNLAHDWEMN